MRSYAELAGEVVSLVIVVLSLASIIIVGMLLMGTMP